MTAPETPLGVLLTDDLMFSSRVTAAARAAGVRVDVVRDLARLRERFGADPPTCVILDLACAGDGLEDFVRGLGDGERRPRIVAYGSHVDAESLRRAREAGCDVVLPRSKFVEELERSLPRWVDR